MRKGIRGSLFAGIKNMKQIKGERLKSKKYILSAIAALVFPVVFFYLLECYTHNPFMEVRPWAQVFNIILFELLAMILFLLTGKIRIALCTEAALTMIFGIANAYVVRFRTNPIVPWDIFSWKTAASVADNYDFTPDSRMIVVTLIFFVVMLALQLIKIDLKKVLLWKRLFLAGMAVLTLCVFSRVLQQEDFQNKYQLYNKLFTPVFMTDVDGIAVTFVMNLAYMSIDKPQGYDAAEAEKFLEQYKGNNAADNGSFSEKEEPDDVNLPDHPKDGYPNIIVMMNESFSDLAVLGQFETNRDYMPYLHSLQEGMADTVTGMLNVSVCGGNTANTEFEFLTGNTMAFLPQGSVPYQQYITGEFPSLASHLQSLGYQTIATHPYNASGWERDTVYPWLGFSESIFNEGYRYLERLRNYTSDAACVDKIIELYEKKEEDKPLFLFQVTMQNHGGYQDLYENFTPEITVEGVDNVSLQQYLSLVERSDQALSELIAYFSGVEEKTVVVFFGDHQPSDTVAYSILSKNGMQWDALDEEELKLRYQVPYVIWANFDIEEAQQMDTSVNFLSANVLRYAGVPTTAYQSFLLELQEEYSVITPIRTVKANGEEVSVAEETEGMDVYQKLQYYQIFDLQGK